MELENKLLEYEKKKGSYQPLGNNEVNNEDLQSIIDKQQKNILNLNTKIAECLELINNLESITAKGKLEEIYRNIHSLNDIVDIQISLYDIKKISSINLGNKALIDKKMITNIGSFVRSLVEYKIKINEFINEYNCKNINDQLIIKNIKKEINKLQIKYNILTNLQKK
jgi:hypothetical protein